MDQTTQPPGTATPPQAVAGQRQGPSTPLTVAALVAVFGAGLLIGALVLGNRSGGGDRSLAASICDVLDQTDSDVTGLDDPGFWRLMGVGPLAHAAGLDDERYADWIEIGDEIQKGAARLDIDLLHEAVGELRADCERLSP